ncbi:hypothetical protein OAS39_13405 [Pirellulales bacterium]|nr:hypothetical protein [Pirellulales bacterium]
MRVGDWKLVSAGKNGARIQAAYQRLYARAAEAREVDLGLAFLDDESSLTNRWPQYAQVLLSAHEIMQIP